MSLIGKAGLRKKIRPLDPRISDCWKLAAWISLEGAEEALFGAAFLR
jgi:hypothetical protein